MTVAIRAGAQLSCSPSNQIKTKQVSTGSNCGAGRVCRAPVVRPHNFQQSPASNHSSSRFHTRNSSQSNKLLCTSPQHYVCWVMFRCHCKMQNPTFPTKQHFCHGYCNKLHVHWCTEPSSMRRCSRKCWAKHKMHRGVHSSQCLRIHV